ncbi:MAG TPA: hypothetical protein VND65_16640 [Candidatus Binatia bacterium]|nr:hypothetical protein [Candidatus Binatia bacterium]
MRIALPLAASLLICSAIACAQSETQAEPSEASLVLELGGTASRSITENNSSFGPSFAAEIEPLENKLEIEAGASSLFRRHSTEWDVDVLFKKPWTLSEKVEFMIGAGPAWIHSRAYGTETTDSAGLEIEPEFMIWRSESHRFGWYVEPTYEYNFGAGHEQSLAVTVGLLIGFHRSK